MQIEIVGRGFTLTEGIRAHVDRRMRFALGRLSGRVAHVRVTLGDENGPKGGRDKTCRVKVGLSGLQDVIVEQADLDLYAAIDRAADRVGRTVARRLDRALLLALPRSGTPTEES